MNGLWVRNAVVDMGRVCEEGDTKSVEMSDEYIKGKGKAVSREMTEGS